MNKWLILRFDIDTHLCMARGVPALLDLAQQLEVKLNFFVNMGRAVSRWQTLKQFWQSTHTPTAAKLSNLKRLGKYGYLQAALLNPLVGKAYPHILQRIIDEGHHLGLHGGQNHALWQRNAHNWTQSKINDEIHWGIKQLHQAGIEQINSFASPGWNNSAYLPQILIENGFTIVADLHGEQYQHIEILQDKLISIPTNLLGEPGGVGYVEHLRVYYQTDTAMINRFITDLQKHSQLAVLYDHPVYAGIQEINFMYFLINTAKEQGFKIINFDLACREIRDV